MTDLDDGDLRALIDGSFGDGPALPPLADTVGAGHRAVRRRRVTTAVSTLAAVLVLTGGALAVTGGDQPMRGTGDPVATSTPDPAVPVVVSENRDFLDSGELVQATPQHRIEVRPGVRVVRQVDEPLGLAAPSWSAGLVLEADGEESWHLVDFRESTPGNGISGSSSSTPGEEAADFDTWLVRRVAEESQPAPSFTDDPLMSAAGASLVEMLPDGSLDLAPGVTVVEQSLDPFGADGPRSHSAAVAFTYEGRERWVLIDADVRDGRVTGSSASVTFADEAAQRSFDAFVAASEDVVRSSDQGGRS